MLPRTALAQGTSGGQFEPGTKDLSVALLLGGAGSYGFGGVGTGLTEGVGAGAQFEVGVTKIANRVTLGIGGGIGFVHNSFGSTYTYTLDQIPIYVLANAHYPLQQMPNLDLYGGVSLGISHASWSYSGASIALADSNDPMVGVQVGGRWAFSDNFSGMVQLGGGTYVPLLTAGITLKF